MIKETLYYKNNYLDEFEAVVENCIEENGKIRVILNETAFILKVEDNQQILVL